ncbi:6-phosphogluconolactonase [Snodgrassella alvi]|uniref:6-phosphogluconolactonase n=1 Tax=Snodgrassella alvi TaxID=1196083 RepID=UPI000C1F701B|nr:6-phosphogluconolactonase [Snodgrassella alvi]PIT39498.1 6-phosphogluconolactonase [Snodgrassella alvi]
MYQLHLFDTPNAMNTALATAITANLQDAINLRSKASLAVSGGPTPVELFQILSQAQIAWNQVYITLVDERWVDKHHEDSNERLIHTHLLQNKAKEAHFISLKTIAENPYDGVDEIQTRLQQSLPLPIDALVLGMGDDGHTASLFPHAENLYKGIDMQSDRLVIDMKPLTAPHDRISLTLPVILNSRHLYLQLNGKKQQQVLEQALAGKNINDMPIRAVLHQQKLPLQIYLAQ